MNSEEITHLIKSGISDAKVHVSSEDNTHFEAIVVSDSFIGKRSIQRHQMIYQCLGDSMGNEIHALTISTYTLDEYSNLRPLK